MYCICFQPLRCSGNGVVDLYKTRKPATRFKTRRSIMPFTTIDVMPARP